MARPQKDKEHNAAACVFLYEHVFPVLVASRIHSRSDAPTRRQVCDDGHTLVVTF